MRQMQYITTDVKARCPVVIQSEQGHSFVAKRHRQITKALGVFIINCLVSCIYVDLWHPVFQLKVLSLSSVYDVCYAENE